MVWPWTLSFWPKNIIRSSVSQDAPVTKVWRKSVNRYGRYRGNIKIWDVFGHAVTLTFDLLTPKSNQFMSVPRCTSDKKLVKISQQILEISQKHKTTTRITDGRTDSGKDGRPENRASARAYRRRRLKNSNKENEIKNSAATVLPMLILDTINSGVPTVGVARCGIAMVSRSTISSPHP